MPVINPNNNAGNSRPPWVREGPKPMPMPSAPWVNRARDQNSNAVENTAKTFDKPILKKTQTLAGESGVNGKAYGGEEKQSDFRPKLRSVPKPFEKSSAGPAAAAPSEGDPDEPVLNTNKHPDFRPKLRHVKTRPDLRQPPQGEESKGTAKAAAAEPEEILNTNKHPDFRPKLRHVDNNPPTPPPPAETQPQVAAKLKRREPPPPPPSSSPHHHHHHPREEEELNNNKPAPKSILKAAAKTADMPSTAPPMPPPPPTAPKPPPPMPGMEPPISRTPMTKEKQQKLESLRSRPRRRPDWTDMMKEVESGKKLKHVQCNDRSAPVISNMKEKGQFVYESEKTETKAGGESHENLLKEIQGGLKLKKVKTNDRSKPNLDGLRKFRRQMTIEEQIQKSVSMADIVAAAVEPDELDDIDKVRDDLQSAKQMLALELRNKEAMERENKRLLARLANLESELEKEKASRNAEPVKGRQVRTEDDEKLIKKLKEEADESHKMVKEMERKYHTTAEELDNTKRKLETAWLKNTQLDLQLKTLASQGTEIPLMRQPSRKLINAMSIVNGSSVEMSDENSESESESEQDEESREKQVSKEIRLLTTKVRTYKEKQVAAKKERKTLKEHLEKRQKEMKEEKKKYKLLQKEVDKMAKLMRESSDNEESEEEEDEEETESDTETEESEEEEEEKSDNEFPPNATAEEKRKILGERAKKHETRLNSMKKINYIVKTNIERLQDDLNKQREMSIALQEDLNNILSDLG